MHDITEWIERLSIKNPIFGNLPPCPFARTALFKVFQTNPEIVIGQWDENLEIAIVIMENISSKELTELAISLSNEEFLVLEDHPDEIEEVEGYNLNYGKPVLLITKRDKMVKARKQLMKTDYYKNFNKTYLEDLLSR